MVVVVEGGGGGGMVIKREIIMDNRETANAKTQKELILMVSNASLSLSLCTILLIVVTLCYINYFLFLGSNKI